MFFMIYDVLINTNYVSQVFSKIKYEFEIKNTSHTTNILELLKLKYDLMALISEFI
jgi:hypothetical protein